MVKNVVNDDLRNIEQVCESDERKAVFDITISEIVRHGLPDHLRIGSAVVLNCTPDAAADTLIVVQKLGIDVMCGLSCEDTKEGLEQSNELAENIEDTMNDAIDDDEYTDTLQNNARQCDPPSECSGLTSASVNDPADVVAGEVVIQEGPSPTPAPNSKTGKSSKRGKATKGSKDSSTTIEKNSLTAASHLNATKSGNSTTLFD